MISWMNYKAALMIMDDYNITRQKGAGESQ